jgi:hypothetical protein
MAIWDSYTSSFSMFDVWLDGNSICCSQVEVVSNQEVGPFLWKPDLAL